MFWGCSQQFKCCSFDPVASFLPSSSCWESQSLFQCATDPILDQFQCCSVQVLILQVTVCHLSVQSRRLQWHIQTMWSRGFSSFIGWGIFMWISPSICLRKVIKPANWESTSFWNGTRKLGLSRADQVVAKCRSFPQKRWLFSRWQRMTNPLEWSSRKSSQKIATYIVSARTAFR